MMRGTSEMPTWFVDNWSAGLHIQHRKVQLLDRAGDQSGWTMSIVMVMKHLLRNVDTEGSASITVAIMKMLVLFVNVSFETGFHIEVLLSLPRSICHMDLQDHFIFFSLVSLSPDPLLVCGRNNIKIGVDVAALTLSGLDPFSGHLAVTNCSRFTVQNNSVWYEVETREGVCGNILRVKICLHKSVNYSFLTGFSQFLSSFFQTNRTHVTYSNTLFIYFGNNTSFIVPKSFPFHCVYPLDTDTSLNVAINPFLK